MELQESTIKYILENGYVNDGEKHFMVNVNPKSTMQKDLLEWADTLTKKDFGGLYGVFIIEWSNTEFAFTADMSVTTEWEFKKFVSGFSTAEMIPLKLESTLDKMVNTINKVNPINILFGKEHPKQYSQKLKIPGMRELTFRSIEPNVSSKME